MISQVTGRLGCLATASSAIRYWEPPSSFTASTPLPAYGTNLTIQASWDRRGAPGHAARPLSGPGAVDIEHKGASVAAYCRGMACIATTARPAGDPM